MTAKSTILLVVCLILIPTIATAAAGINRCTQYISPWNTLDAGMCAMDAHHLNSRPYSVTIWVAGDHQAWVRQATATDALYIVYADAYTYEVCNQGERPLEYQVVLDSSSLP